MGIDPNHNLKDNILRKIRSGDIAVRPKIYFTIKMAALAAVAFAVLVISIFIFNFIFFSIRVNSQDALLGFGPRGILMFLVLFPWKLLLLDIALVMLLEELLRRFSIGYRSPVLYLLLGLLAVASVLGLVLDRGTGFNDHLFIRAREGHGLPPPFQDAYRNAQMPFPIDSGICKCVVVSVGTSTLLVRDSGVASSTFTVMLPPGLPLPQGALEPGDMVLVAGTPDGQKIIRIFGIQKIQDESR